jgi:IAA-amino acid hydrolase
VAHEETVDSTMIAVAAALVSMYGLPGSKLSDSAVAKQSEVAAKATLQQASKFNDWTVQNRRNLHMQPELLYELDKTSAYIRGKLDELKISYQHPVGGRVGIVATIGTGKSPCVGLRADMDALPIFEEVASSYRSKEDGCMHACGHDAHVSMLLTAARILKLREKELKGTVKLIFQPAEEGGAGGLAMVQAGLMEAEPRIERAFALHVWPGMPSGMIETRTGTLMAAAGFFHAQFHGHGGHAAMPHTTTDPLMCVGSALSGLQTVVARNLHPVEAGVVSTTFVRGGSAYNVIPDSVEMGGTIRSLTKPGYRFLDERVAAVLRGAAAMHGCKLNLTASKFEAECLHEPAPKGAPGACTFPPTINSKSAFEIGRDAATALVGEERFRVAEPTMGGEDFAYLAEKVPSAMLFLGIGNATLGTNVNLHSPKFRMDEDQMQLGAALHVEMALRSLSKPASRRRCADVIDDSELDEEGAAMHAQCEEGTNMENED